MDSCTVADGQLDFNLHGLRGRNHDIGSVVFGKSRTGFFHVDAVSAGRQIRHIEIARRICNGAGRNVGFLIDNQDGCARHNRSVRISDGSGNGC